MNIDDNCVYCNVYYEDRKVLLNKKKFKCTSNLLPLNLICQNINCNSYEKIYTEEDNKSNFKIPNDFDDLSKSIKKLKLSNVGKKEKKNKNLINLLKNINLGNL